MSGVGSLAVDGPSSWLSIAPALKLAGSPSSSPPQKKKKQTRPFEVKQALAAARRVAEAHRTASHVMSQPYDSPGSPSGDDDDDEYEEEEEEIVWARVEADEAEADRKFTSSISTTRSVWDARLKVLKSATAYSALAARRETELVLMSEELLDVELRERVKKVRKNSVQRRLRDLVRTMQAWRRAVVMVEADKFAAEQAQKDVRARRRAVAEQRWRESLHHEKVAPNLGAAQAHLRF